MLSEGMLHAVGNRACGEESLRALENRIAGFMQPDDR
jgi:hypothetical protein